MENIRGINVRSEKEVILSLGWEIYEEVHYIWTNSKKSNRKVYLSSGFGYGEFGAYVVVNIYTVDDHEMLKPIEGRVSHMQFSGIIDSIDDFKKLMTQLTCF